MADEILRARRKRMTLAAKENFARRVRQLKERVQREGKTKEMRTFLAERVILHYQAPGITRKEAYRLAWLDAERVFRPDPNAERNNERRLRQNHERKKRREYKRRHREKLKKEALKMEEEKRLKEEEEAAEKERQEKYEEVVEQARHIGLQDVTALDDVALPLELAFALYNLHMILDPNDPDKQLISPSDAPNMACWNMLLMAAENKSAFQQVVTRELIALKKADDDFARKEAAKRAERAERWAEEKDRLIEAYEDKLSELEKKLRADGGVKRRKTPVAETKDDVRDMLRRMRDDSQREEAKAD